jgi:hypothetical protein
MNQASGLESPLHFGLLPFSSPVDQTCPVNGVGNQAQETRLAKIIVEA